MAMLGITAMLLFAGLAHHNQVLRDRSAMRDAIIRAQAFIGARAPDEFRSNLAYVDVFAIQEGSIYRTCVLSIHRDREYCVIVKTKLPFAQSVSFAGYEPNSVFGRGVN
jgi:hypothetical protein